MPQENESQYIYVMATLPGIITGCLMYFFGATVIVTIFEVVQQKSMSWFESAITIFAMIGISISIGFGSGLLFLLLYSTINRTLANWFSARIISLAAAVATGYFPVACVVSQIWFDRNDIYIAVSAAVLGPVLATAIVSLSSWHFERTRIRPCMTYPACRTRQFSIRTLMVLTAWSAVVVLLAQLISHVIPTIWSVLLGYVVMLLAMIGLTQLLERIWEPAIDAAGK